MIHGKPVECEALPLGKKYIPPDPDQQWVSRYIQQACCSLHIAKWFNAHCCKHFISDWPTVFRNSFILSPLLCQCTKYGITTAQLTEYFAEPSKYEINSLKRRLLRNKYPEEANGTSNLPIDLYYQSMEKSWLKGVCKKSAQYWPSEPKTK